MFPLPNVYLFPGAIMPLHVFEPRYRMMVQDQLDQQGRIAVANIEEHSGSPEGNPPVHPMAGLGEIAHHRRLPDGRFLIWLIGLCRVKIEEAESSKPYRIVEAEIAREIEASDEEAEEVRAHLEEAISKRSNGELLSSESIPLGAMVDALLQCLQLPHAIMQPMFSELDISRRAKQALLEHSRHPLPKKE